MSEQQMPLSYESVLALILKNAEESAQQWQEMKRQFQETDERLSQRFQETDERIAKQTKETNRKISALGSRVGEIVENMVGGDIVEQFQTLGYNVTAHSRNKNFGKEGTDESGEIDLLLEDGDVAILIEVKTKPTADDVLDHIERLEKYRNYLDRGGRVDCRQLVGAIAGASVHPDVIKFAQRKGLHVIVQAGRTVEIIPSPEGFVAKRW